ncbi:TetR family transcriptional regulator C-terminal domain-containing protein [Streptomyces sp. NPDC041068]|uniref:TetR/AcrR family transcriptional regulator n=1 Tax=Streptomyces sp. NPDC041068 TaxID=3155130 RepID=UPI0033D92D84
MPKVVDHEERRGRLVEAVWELTVREGLEGVTLRKVAAEAGVSMGQVQHYYASMRELIRDAFTRAQRSVDAKVRASIESAAPADSAASAASTAPEAILRTCLHALLARDEETSRLVLLSVAGLGRAVSDPRLAEVFAPQDDSLREFTASLLTEARRERGTEGEEFDALTEADICWSLAESLATDVALGLRTPESAERLMTHHIDGTLTRT